MRSNFNIKVFQWFNYFYDSFIAIVRDLAAEPSFPIMDQNFLFSEWQLESTRKL
jgi:hypothetical protein